MIGGWLIPLLAAGGFIGLLELANYYSPWLILFGGLAVAWPILCSGFFLRLHRRSVLATHHFSLPFLSLIISAFLIFIFIDRPLLRQIIIIVAGILVYLDFFYLSLLARGSAKYPPRALERIGSVLLALSAFFIFSALFGWVTFLANTFWPTMVLALLISWLLDFEALFLNHRETAKVAFISLIISVLIVEFFWVISLWPLGFLIKGWILTIIMLNGLGIASDYMDKRFHPKKTLIRGIFSAVLIVLIMVLARWI
ncbi:MAG: hypothetical protein AAB568_02460 [Patescibacteria group bacterium]